MHSGFNGPPKLARGGRGGSLLPDYILSAHNLRRAKKDTGMIAMVPYVSFRAMQLTAGFEPPIMKVGI